MLPGCAFVPFDSRNIHTKYEADWRMFRGSSSWHNIVEICQTVTDNLPSNVHNAVHFTINMVVWYFHWNLHTFLFQIVSWQLQAPQGVLCQYGWLANLQQIFTVLAYQLTEQFCAISYTTTRSMEVLLRKVQSGPLRLFRHFGKRAGFPSSDWTNVRKGWWSFTIYIKSWKRIVKNHSSHFGWKKSFSKET